MARRDDLLEKSLNNIIKYFLCSEHFADDCFLDPPLNTKLKKTSRPVTVPLPSIFKCNIGQYIKVGDPLSLDTAKSDELAIEDTTKWIPTISNNNTTTGSTTIESNTIRDSNPEQETETNNITEVIPLQLHRIETTIFDGIENRKIDSTELSQNDNNMETMDDECMYLNKSASFDDIEAYCLSDVIDVSPIYRDNEISFIIEKQFDDDTQVEANDAASSGHSGKVTPLTSERGLEERTDYIGDTCRLCAETFDTDVGLMNIFAEDNEYLMDDINILMPNMVSICLVRRIIIFLCYFCRYYKTMDCLSRYVLIVLQRLQYV